MSGSEYTQKNRSWPEQSTLNKRSLERFGSLEDQSQGMSPAKSSRWSRRNNSHDQTINSEVSNSSSISVNIEFSGFGFKSSIEENLNKGKYASLLNETKENVRKEIRQSSYETANSLRLSDKPNEKTNVKMTGSKPTHLKSNQGANSDFNSSLSELTLAKMEQEDKTFRPPDSDISAYFGLHSEPLKNPNPFDESILSIKTDYNGIFSECDMSINKARNITQKLRSRSKKNLLDQTFDPNMTLQSTTSSKFMPSSNSTQMIISCSETLETLQSGQSSKCSSTIGRESKYASKHNELQIARASELRLTITPKNITIRIPTFLCHKLNYLRIENSSSNICKSIVNYSSNSSAFKITKERVELILPAWYSGSFDTGLRITPVECTTAILKLDVVSLSKNQNVNTTIECELHSDLPTLKLEPASYQLYNSSVAQLHCFDESQLCYFYFRLANNYEEKIPMKFIISNHTTVAQKISSSKEALFPVSECLEDKRLSYRFPDKVTLVTQSSDKTIPVPIRLCTSGASKLYDDDNCKSPTASRTTEEYTSGKPKLLTFDLTAMLDSPDYPHTFSHNSIHGKLSNQVLQTVPSKLVTLPATWTELSFRNKSHSQAICVELFSSHENVAVLFRSKKFIVKPNGKFTNAIFVQERTVIHNFKIIVQYSGGKGEPVRCDIPILFGTSA